MTTNTANGISVRKRQCQEQPVWQLVGIDGQPVEQAERFIHTLVLRGLSPLTRRTYAYDLLAAYRWMAEADRQPDQLTGDDLVEFIDYLQRPPPASPSTINRRLRLLQRFVEFLTGNAPVVAAWRQYNHALHFHSRSRRGSLRIKEPHRVIHPLKDRQVLEFYSSLRTWRDRSMVLLMWAEGRPRCLLSPSTILMPQDRTCAFMARAVSNVSCRWRKQCPPPCAFMVNWSVPLRAQRPYSSYSKGNGVVSR